MESSLLHDAVPGQRWMSETQAELGLGIVTAREGRYLEIAYPAAGETRRYALPDAPLIRVALVPGERVRDRAGRVLRVTGIRTDAGLITYHCLDPQGITCLLPESELDDRLRPNRPPQRLLSGRIDADHWFTLRYETWLQGMREADSPVLGLVGARIALIPHQLQIAAEVAGREAPRVLLADDVGLGKTIEAGLILHRMLLTDRARRILVVTPEPLVYQWLVELRRRFNLRFSHFDRERCEASTTANPFLAEQLVLCSLDLLLSGSDIAQAALAGQWDLLVVDEAHHLVWSETDPSPAYRLVAELAERTAGVLLLTATPEQLGRAGHFGRLRLLDPARFHDYTAFEAEVADYAPVAALAARLLDGAPLDLADQERLATLLGATAGLTRDQIIERLLDRHGTGRVLFRNTRAAIPGFPGRQLLSYPLPEPPIYHVLDAEAVARLTPEQVLGAAWVEQDPRVPWLIDILRGLRPAKVLLICAHAGTVLDLREVLLRRAGIHAAIFHEGMTLVERDRAAAYFAAVEEGTRILLCSEIGSEGRNFQFVHHLVLFDLPLDPDLLEQRIGRLDRIGQTQTIRIHVPYLSGGPGEVLFRWYAEALGAFTAICPAAPAVYTVLRQPLLAALTDPGGATTVLATARDLRERLTAELAAGRDRLLELHSHRPAVAATLVETIASLDARRGVADYLGRFWDAFGVEHEPGVGGSVVARPGPRMLHETFPQLPEEGLTLTFERADALAHEDRAFITWEHPLVREAMELLTASDLGTSAMTLLRDARFKPAMLLLEILYVAECPAPPEQQIRRFLPPTVVRLLLDPEGQDRAGEIPHTTLRGECLTARPAVVRSVIQSQVPRLARMLEQGESLARAAVERLERASLARMHQVLGEEIDRLRALAQVNPTVRPDEIARLESRRDQLTDALTQVQLRLDALRLIVII